MDDFGIDSGILIDNDMNVAGDMSTVGVWSNFNSLNKMMNEGEWLYLRGRRAYCKDQGLSGKALRECKKQLREADKSLTKEELRQKVAERKSGAGLMDDMLYNEGKGGLDTNQYDPNTDRLMSDPTLPPPSKPKTGLIIGVSVGALVLIGLLVWYFKFRKK